MADAIAAFWSWWKTARRRVEKALEARDLDALEGEITAHVQAIEPGLKWELGPGEGDKKVAFALVWDGELQRRRLAARWLARAPAKDPLWSYHSARPAGKGWKDLVMQLGRHKVALGDFVCTFDIDKSKERIDAKIWSQVRPPSELRAMKVRTEPSVLGAPVVELPRHGAATRILPLGRSVIPGSCM